VSYEDKREKGENVGWKLMLEGCWGEEVEEGRAIGQ
jgi:hypothetical protein